MTRIAIIVEDDPIWCLSAWENALPDLQKHGYFVVGIWCCPAVLNKMKSYKIPLWYLRTFGLGTFLKLTAFALVARATRLFRALRKEGVRDFPSLARSAGVPFSNCSSPNDPAFVEWMRESAIDILVIMTGFILKKYALAVPRIGIINKHAGALPANGGLHSYFWAFLGDTQQGLTFHRVTAGIDQGPLLAQDLHFPPESLTSMVRFYLYTYKLFPSRLLQSLANCVEGRELQPVPGIAPSYQLLPSRKDVALFRAKGGKIICCSDILRATDL